ncbi:MAG: nicotinate-nucleotide--dimethylbenzimidazole phosphoribosyltransferase [Rhodocyclaceae bacterium]
MKYHISALDTAWAPTLQARLDSRTKPLGSLGRLEALAVRIGCIQQTTAPRVQTPRIAVFAGDHGAAHAGVSAYPQAVTGQMVHNFLVGGAAINVLARTHGLALSIIDAGVASDYPRTQPDGIEYVDARIAPGTANYIDGPAMSPAQCDEAITHGMALAHGWAAAGTDAIGFGEMGIGNTASASLITKLLCATGLDEVVGRGTGLDDAGLARKRALLAQALARIDGGLLSPEAVLTEFGGFEIAMMTGAFIGAAQAGLPIVVDGFIVTSALLVAAALSPAVRDYCVFAHCSDEPGHALQLAHLGQQPLLQLGMRLGEGTGAALAMPLLRSAVALLNDMAGFDDAGVSRAD